MKKMRQLYLLSVSFMIVLSLAVNSTYAIRPKHVRRWEGLQIPDPCQSLEELEVSFEYSSPTLLVIEISGIGLVVIDGYEFGNTKVRYELIDSMTIEVDLTKLPQDGVLNIYSYPHEGHFIWYDKHGEVVGTGTFESEGSNEGPFGGSLEAEICRSKKQYIVTGEYWVMLSKRIEIGGWTVLYPVLLGHAGQYTVTDC